MRFQTGSNTLLASIYLILTASLALLGLDPQKRITQYDIRVYQAEHGLPQNALKDVFQDSRGYIWIASQEGLARFDGVRFVLFDKSKYPGLKEDFIWDIVEDREGNLWLATNGGGVSRFDGKTFTTYDTSHGLASNVVYTVLISKDHTIWFGTEAGLTRLKNGVFTSYRFSGNQYDQKIISIHENKQGNLLIGRRDYSLTIFRNDSLYTLLSKGYWIHCFWERASGEIIMGVGSGELFVYHHNRVEKFFPHQLPTTHAIRAIHEDRGGNLWFCTEGGGIIRYYDGRFDSLTVENGLPGDNNFFYKMIEDREGSLWFVSDGGLFRLKDNKFMAFGRNEGFPSNYGHTICEDTAGNMWAGLRDRGLVKFDRYNTSAWGTEQGLSSNGVTSVFPARDGSLWIGTSYGLNNLKDDKFFGYRREEELGYNSIVALHENAHGALWIGAVSGYLTKFDRQRFETHRIAEGESGSVISILERENGEVWAGTWKKGLYKLWDGKIHRLTEKDGFTADGVNAFYEDEERVLWIATDGHGLYRYKDGKFARFTSRNGLCFDLLFSILEDDQHYLWFSGNRGIFRVRKQQLNDFAEGKADTIICQAYNHYDGMREAECNGRRQPLAWKSRDGRLWFVGIAGVLCVDPDNMPMNETIPPVYIEEITANQQRTFSPDSGVIPLEAHERELAIRYTALSFAIPERVRFKYKLQGYDQDWIDAGARRTAFYTNLPRGNYTFQVIACNNDGVWNEEGAAVRLRIAPFWWETWWAYLLYALVIGLVFYGLRSYEMKRVRLRNELKVEHMRLEELKELDHLKTCFFAGISHEFRTPLTLIGGPLQDLLEKSPGGQEKPQIEMMLRNTRRLQRLVDQLLDLAQLESGKMVLQARPARLVPFLKSIIAAFESYAKRKNISLEFRADGLPQAGGSPEEDASLTVYLDPDKMEKVLINLLANALKYTQGGGAVIVDLSISDLGLRISDLKEQNKSEIRNPKSEISEFVRIRVRDTGIGIPENALPHIFDYFYRYRDQNNRQETGSGIGLALCKELVELHRGEISAASKAGEGSEFTIRLPLGKAHLKPEEIADSSISDGSTGAYPEFTERLPTSLGFPEGAGEVPDLKDRDQSEIPDPESPIILLVEDNPDMRQYLRRHLARQYRLLEAQDGEEGYQKAAAEIPEVIISDVMMPKMDGFEMCRRLKTSELTSHIPVILLTAKGSGESKLEGLELGADEYLTKPFEARELHLRIRNLLEQQRKMQQRFRQQVTVVQVEPADIELPSREKEFMQKALRIIEARMSNAKFGAAALAREMDESEKQLNRKIHNLFGANSTELIRSMRLKRAAQLLQQRSGTVSEIAFDVGFSNLSYFARCFKRQYGKAPSEFMNEASSRQ